METSPHPRPPLWATTQFRWLVAVLVAASAIIAVLVFKFIPSLEPRKLELPAGQAPVVTIRSLDDLAKAGKAPHGDLLAGVRDGTPSNEADAAYLALVKRLRDIPAADLAKDAVRVDYKLFATDPGALRGRVVRVLALIIDDVTATPLVLDEGTVGLVYRTHLLNGNDGYIADVLERPSGIGKRDLVLLNGVFVKMATYEGRPIQGEKGPRIITAPLIMGRELVRVEERAALETWDEHMMYVAGIIAAVLLLGVTAWAFLSARGRGNRPPRRLLPPRPAGAAADAPPSFRPAPASPGDGAVRKRAPRAPPLRRHAAPAAGRRFPVVRIVVLGLFLAGIAGYMFFLRKGGRSEPLEAARLAHEKILEVESKAWSRGEALGPEDLRSIRTSQRVLISAHDGIEERLRALESQGKWASDESKALAKRLREIRLWILDASEVVEAEASGNPSSAGVFIPHRLARKDLEAAEAALGALEGGPLEGAREKLAALKSDFEGARESLTRLAARVKEGLAREDLTPAQLPFLGTLEEEAARAEDGVRRVEALLARVPG
jgi:hypothetical protein